jgi:hypothetical protein
MAFLTKTSDYISTVSSVHRPLLQGATNCSVFHRKFFMINIFQFKNLLLFGVLSTVLIKQRLKTYLQKKAVRSYKKNLVSNSLSNYIECAGDLKCMK